MKRKMFILIALLFTFGYSNSTWACEIEIDTHESTKKFYQMNDAFLVTIRVFLTHHNCPEGIKATKYKMEGIKVLGASQWKAESTYLFTRVLKIKIVGVKNNQAIFHVIRQCDKEGGYAKLVINVHAKNY
jgi:hypothetical protein